MGLKGAYDVIVILLGNKYTWVLNRNLS